MNMYSTFVQTNGITLHVPQAGPARGRPVVLLHGFPEFHYGWRHQVPALVAAGFHVLAPDQRGYNLSDCPRSIEAYRAETLVDDIVGLLDACGIERADIVGHDWGGAIAWGVAGLFPARVRRLVVVNLPHPAVFTRYISRDLGQMRRSWYMLFFQLPWLPEWVLSRRGAATLRRLMRASSRSDSFSDEDLARYQRAWRRPGRMTGMLNWYRALRYARPTRYQRMIAAPTLILWGKLDAALRHEMARDSLDYCHEAELRYFPRATHWVQHDEATAVNEELTRFLSAS